MDSSTTHKQNSVADKYIPFGLICKTLMLNALLAESYDSIDQCTALCLKHVLQNTADSLSFWEDQLEQQTRSFLFYFSLLSGLHFSYLYGCSTQPVLMDSSQSYSSISVMESFAG